jgi:hypothetical protein
MQRRVERVRRGAEHVRCFTTSWSNVIRVERVRRGAKHVRRLLPRGRTRSVPCRTCSAFWYLTSCADVCTILRIRNGWSASEYWADVLYDSFIVRNWPLTVFPCRPTWILTIDQRITPCLVEIDFRIVVCCSWIIPIPSHIYWSKDGRVLTSPGLRWGSDASCFPVDIQRHIIGFLDIGEGTPQNCGYVTPYAWVCVEWCREIRRRIYRRCNLKRAETANWFLQSVYKSVVPFAGCPGVGRFITILSFSFVPPEAGDYCFRLDWSDGYMTSAYATGLKVCDFKTDTRSFWDRLKDAARYMTSLETLCIAYSNLPEDFVIFDTYSECVHAFSSTLKTLIIRPLNNDWVSFSFSVSVTSP